MTLQLILPGPVGFCQEDVHVGGGIGQVEVAVDLAMLDGPPNGDALVLCQIVAGLLHKIVGNLEFLRHRS